MESEGTKQEIKKGPWKPEEDLLLKKYIEIHGEGKWATVSKKSGLKRGGKSCRLRWKNYLRPNLKRGEMSEEEEDLIIRMHKLLGNRWSLIAGRLPGRTDNEIKNYWNTHLIKRCPQGKRVASNSKRKKVSHSPVSQPICNGSPRNTIKGSHEMNDEPSAVPHPWMDDLKICNYDLQSGWLPGNTIFYDEPFLDSIFFVEALAQNDVEPWTASPFYFQEDTFMQYSDGS